MKKTLTKLIAFILVLALSVPVFTAAFSVFAEDGVVADSTVAPTYAEDDEDSEVPLHKTFTQLIVEFFQSVYSFFKYIFYDVWLGKPAPEVPEAPTAA